MSNSNDCSNEEQMLLLLTDLQTENESLRAKIQPIEPLIATIKQQEKSLTELSAYNKSLTEENEKLLKLSESEKKLSEENSSLKRSESALKNELRQKEQENDALMKQTEDLAARIARLNQAMPTQEDIKALSKAMRGAERSADNMNMLHIVNTSVFAVFAFLVVLTGGQVYKFRQKGKKASEGIKSVNKAGYNTEEGSVFDGTIMKEEKWKRGNQEEVS